MVCISKLAVTLSLFFLFVPVGMGDAFTEADRLYQQRQDNLEMIAEAREAYINLISVDGPRAIQGIGLLAYYEGGQLLERGDRRRVEIFKQCRNLVEEIAVVQMYASQLQAMYQQQLQHVPLRLSTSRKNVSFFQVSRSATVNPLVPLVRLRLLRLGREQPWCIRLGEISLRHRP